MFDFDGGCLPVYLIEIIDHVIFRLRSALLQASCQKGLRKHGSHRCASLCNAFYFYPAPLATAVPTGGQFFMGNVVAGAPLR